MYFILKKVNLERLAFEIFITFLFHELSKKKQSVSINFLFVHSAARGFSELCC
jgi:hypothetical protein